MGGVSRFFSVVGVSMQKLQTLFCSIKSNLAYFSLKFGLMILTSPLYMMCQVFLTKTA